MNKFVTMILAATLTVTAQAAPWLYTAAQNTNAAVAQLKAWGVTNTADQTAILASGFDAQTTFAVAMRDSAWPLACRLSQDKSVSVSNTIALGRALLTANPPPPATPFIYWLQSIPLEQRARFSAMAAVAVPLAYPLSPVGGSLFLKYSVMRGVHWNDPGVATDQELTTYLLAPEEMAASSALMCKQAIKDRATALARIQLRGMASPPAAASNGVSVVATMIAPVVTALNAPMCTGLDGALQALGSPVTNMDRTALPALAATWQTNAMNSVTSPAKVAAQLGKISVVLGVDAFNAWVNLYNAGN